MINLDTIESAASAATPGPRTARCRDINFPATGMSLVEWPRDEFLQCEVDGIPEPDGRGTYYGADAAFIALADPQTILALVRIARAAIAADDALHSPHTAEQAALRDLLKAGGDAMSVPQFLGSFLLCLVAAVLAIPSIDANPLTRWHKVGLGLAVACCLPMFVCLWIWAIAG